eukprot:TRINITY_DN29889_c0_g1_i1.p1 TRINITY_DN29889_c0_g1~~TRINITY_DN29889_c0_g1_i1.p1  ORF type:complete len:245 (+),score=64.05 TRINITY_DN29889_c0_g1_i1:98-832(+)
MAAAEEQAHGAAAAEDAESGGGRSREVSDLDYSSIVQSRLEASQLTELDATHIEEDVVELAAAAPTESAAEPPEARTLSPKSLHMQQRPLAETDGKLNTSVGSASDGGAAHGRTQLRKQASDPGLSRTSGHRDQTSPLGTPVATRSVPKRRGAYDPGKIYSKDGSFRLRGVSSLSDVRRYTSNVDPFSRRAWEVREAYKLMRASQHSAAAQQTWGALHSWAASEKPFDEWQSQVKKGAKFKFRD